MGDTNCLLCLSGAVYQVFYPEGRQSRWASDDKQITGSGLGSAAGVIGCGPARRELSATIGASTLPQSSCARRVAHSHI